MLGDALHHRLLHLYTRIPNRRLHVRVLLYSLQVAGAVYQPCRPACRTRIAFTTALQDCLLPKPVALLPLDMLVGVQYLFAVQVTFGTLNATHQPPLLWCKIVGNQ